MPPKPALTPAVGEFGARIRRRRTEMGLSQEVLADRAGLHWTYIGQTERGQRNIALVNILKIAAALEIDAADLITGLRPA